MKPRHMLAIVLVWAALLGGYLGSTLGFSAHELVCEEPQDCVLTNTSVESNGFLMRIFYVLFWIHNGPHSDLYLRLPNLILSLASLVAIYLLGTEIVVSRRQLAGILSAFYLGINALFISVLAHMRFYSANMFLIILATYCLIKARQWESGRWLAGYAACMAGAVGTMMLSSLAALPHALYYVGSAADRRRACRQVAILSLGLGAWFYLLYCRDPEAVSRFNYQVRSLLEVVQPLLANGYAGDEHVPQIWHQFCQNYTPTLVALMAATSVLVLAFLGRLLWAFTRQDGRETSATDRQAGGLPPAAQSVCGPQEELESSRAKRAWCSKGSARDMAPWLGVFTVAWAIGIYQMFSQVSKPIAIPLNFTWVLPFMALTLAQATLVRGWRWLYLALVLCTVPDTHMSFLADGDTNLKIMHAVEVWRRPEEPLLVAYTDQPAWHYLRSKYGAERQGGPQTNGAHVGIDLACGDGLLLYERQEFPAIMNAICQQKRPGCGTVWILTYQNRPLPALGEQHQDDNDADFYRNALARALGGVRSDCLMAESDQTSFLYRISLPAVRQLRPQIFQYRWRSNRDDGRMSSHF